jgi:hypothetical protein
MSCNGAACLTGEFVAMPILARHPADNAAPRKDGPPPAKFRPDTPAESVDDAGNPIPPSAP